MEGAGGEAEPVSCGLDGEARGEEAEGEGAPFSVSLPDSEGTIRYILVVEGGSGDGQSWRSVSWWVERVALGGEADKPPELVVESQGLTGH